MADDSHKIGQLNGKWAFLLKITVICVPISLPWFVWSTSESFANMAFRNSGDRFTREDALIMRSDLVELIADSPGEAWRTRLAGIEANQMELMRAMVRVETRLDTVIGEQP